MASKRGTFLISDADKAVDDVEKRSQEFEHPSTRALFYGRVIDELIKLRAIEQSSVGDYRCVVCHSQPVHPDLGEDTCSFCIARFGGSNA